MADYGISNPEGGYDLMGFLNQQIRDYCIGNISSRWFVTGMNVCGAGGR